MAVSAVGSLDRCRLDGNGDVLHVGGGFSPIHVTIRDSVAAGNTIGFSADGGAQLTSENCLVASNNTGDTSSGGTATVRVSATTITDNALGISESSGGAMLSRSNNTVEGNDTNGSFTGTYSAK